MGVFIVYRQSGEHARRVEEFLHDFQRRTATDLKVVDPDTAEGADICRMYDIVEYPTIVATAKDGGMRNMWRGITLPTIDEVSYYV